MGLSTVGKRFGAPPPSSRALWAVYWVSDSVIYAVGFWDIKDDDDDDKSCLGYVAVDLYNTAVQVLLFSFFVLHFLFVVSVL